ncbi:MAG: iron-containing alcohol dehydrogenase [Firmicutes bacterium]|nr:iron-containing alcohol dehydrogenase [Bacillota bacterium]
MDITTLNTQNLSRYAGASFQCGCGVCHTVATQSVVFGPSPSLETFFAPLLPSLGVVTVISDAQIRDKTERAFEKRLSRAGYRVHTHTLETGSPASLETAAKVIVPEEAFLVAGAGGGTVADLTKYVAAAKKLPCALILTSPAALGSLTPSAMLHSDGGVEEIYKTPPFSGVFCDMDFLTDLPPALIPAAFGELAAKAVSLFDYKFAHLIAGERFCPHLYELGFAAIDETLARFRDRVLGEKEAAAILAESSLRFSALGQLTGNSRLFCGGEAQAAHALRLLFKHEQRPLKLRGETEFLLSRIVLEVYKNFLARPANFFVPPPSNARRAEKITEYLGVPEKTAIGKMRAIPSPEKLKLFSYRLNEYRDELYEAVCLNAVRLNRAWRVFKRLYPDDGFGLVNYIEPPDAALALALAPDLKEKFTLLSFMKDAGLLDEHIR